MRGGYVPDGEDLAYMRDQGFRYHVMERALSEATEGGAKYLYISFDMDTIDPGFAPGTGTPEPGGLTPREVFPLVRRLCAETNVVGMETVELNPLVDPTYVTPLVANRAVREMITGVAMRKQGLTDRHYLAPEALDHGRG